MLLVLTDQNFDTFAIYEAARAPVIAAITRPGSKARNERGALSIPSFCRTLGQKIWQPATT